MVVQTMGYTILSHPIDCKHLIVEWRSGGKPFLKKDGTVSTPEQIATACQAQGLLSERPARIDLFLDLVAPDTVDWQRDFTTNDGRSIISL